MSANFPQPFPIINRNASLVKRISDYEQAVKCAQMLLDLVAGVVLKTECQFMRKEQVSFSAFSVWGKVTCVCTRTAQCISQVSNVFVKYSHNFIIPERSELSNA